MLRILLTAILLMLSGQVSSGRPEESHRVRCEAGAFRAQLARLFTGPGSSRQRPGGGHGFVRHLPRLAQRYFPNATIVADRFHVVRLINQHSLKVWQQHHPEGRKNRGLLNLMRRHQWHLSDEQDAKLMTYLAEYPVLQALYAAKQQLVRFMLLKTLTARRARATLPAYLELLEQLRDSPVRTLANTLTSWMAPIIAMWRFTKTNGITEGFHNKMEMISRRAYGFRNFDNYRWRMLTHCGWDGIINRVRMNAHPPLMG